MKYVVNDDLFMVQSRLNSASQEVTGRWVIYVPDTKKTYSVPSKSNVPPVVRFLVDESERGFDDGNAQVDQLKKAMLIRCDQGSRVGSSSFVALYHSLVFDYPFWDYSQEGWRQKDQELMLSYSNGGEQPPPPVYSVRSGERFQLPTVAIDLIESCTSLHSLSSLEKLSLILTVCFRHIGEIDGGRFGPWLRKTSPSGGARHPTDALIELSGEFSDFDKGVYWYSPEDNALVFVDAGAHIASGFSIHFCAHVERPMWRYRDIRSFRAIPIDVGHVVETSSIVANKLGLNQAIRQLSYQKHSFENVVSDPCFLTVDYSENLDAITSLDRSGIKAGVGLPIVKPGGNLNTNPFSYCQIKNSDVIVSVLYPERQTLSLSIEEFELITYSQVSRRNDRKSSILDLQRLFPRVRMERIQEFIRSGLLMDRDEVVTMASGCSEWVKKGWYISLLLYLDSYSVDGNSIYISGSSPAIELTNPQLARSMLNRKTARSFGYDAISVTDVEQLLNDVFSFFVPINDYPMVIVGLAENNCDAKMRLFEYSISPSFIRENGSSIAREEVVSMMAGQRWAGGGSANVWVFGKADVGKPGQYMSNLVDLGRVGQRICLVGEARGFDVFMTPAVIDSIAEECFGSLLGSMRDFCIYNFTIGKKSESD